MKGTAILLVAALWAFGGIACGDESDSASSSSSSSSCQHQFQCTNGACECSTSGKQGTTCCDPADCGSSNANSCETVCEVCS